MPGSLFVFEPQVPAQDSSAQQGLSNLLSTLESFLADMHYTEPSKALLLAKARGILPQKVLVLACQPAVYDELGIGLSDLCGDGSGGGGRVCKGPAQGVGLRVRRGLRRRGPPPSKSSP